MKPYYLAFCLVRIPRLFVSLFMWPVFLGLILVVGQTLLSFSVVQFGNEDAEAYRVRKEDARNPTWIRELVYGSEAQLPPLRICTWVLGANGVEVPPSAECVLKENNVAIRVLDPAAYSTEDFSKLYNGATETLHICRTCSASVTIDLTAEDTQSTLNAGPGLGVYLLSKNEMFRIFDEFAVEGRTERERMEALQGQVWLQSGALAKPINVDDAQTRMVFVLNIAMIIVVAFWLGIKAHRKVLDYFIKNGVLLPLVASCGKHAVYQAMWLLSMARTVLFVILALLPLYYSTGFAAKYESSKTFDSDITVWLAWLASMGLGLGVLTIVVSTADLRERGEWYTVFIRYLPPMVWTIGTLIWLAALLGDGESAGIIRNIISVVPVAGLSAVLLAPLVQPHVGVLIAHAFLSVIVVYWVLSSNTNYFAMHVEEL